MYHVYCIRDPPCVCVCVCVCVCECDSFNYYPSILVYVMSRLHADQCTKQCSGWAASVDVPLIMHSAVQRVAKSASVTARRIMPTHRRNLCVWFIHFSCHCADSVSDPSPFSHRLPSIAARLSVCPLVDRFVVLGINWRVELLSSHPTVGYITCNPVSKTDRETDRLEAIHRSRHVNSVYLTYFTSP